MTLATIAKWAIGPVRIATADGRVNIAGWIRSAFGIDWRPHGNKGDPAYIVTHLATGWSLFAVTANIEEVKAIVDELELLFDWSGGDVDVLHDRIGSRRADLRQFIADHGGKDPSPFCAPAGDHL